MKKRGREETVDKSSTYTWARALRGPLADAASRSPGIPPRVLVRPPSARRWPIEHSFLVHLSDRFLLSFAFLQGDRVPHDRRPLIVRTHDRFTSERARGPPIDTDRATVRPPRASLGFGGGGRGKKKERKRTDPAVRRQPSDWTTEKPKRPATGVSLI